MIKEFRGKTKWLSNFSPVKIVIDGIEYPSTEHAYMSAKCANPTWKKVLTLFIKNNDKLTQLMTLARLL